MKERGVGNIDTQSGLTGKKTAELLGDANGFGASWTTHSGLYPQLGVFTNPESFLEEDRNTVKAYSAASVCTAQLYPSNDPSYLDSAEDYDTVRSIRYLFPLTNNEFVNDSQYDVSWEADDIKCSISGMENLQVISLKPDTYATTSLAPGVGWLTVYVKYYPNPSDKSNYTICLLYTSKALPHKTFTTREGYLRDFHYASSPYEIVEKGIQVRKIDARHLDVHSIQGVKEKLNIPFLERSSSLGDNIEITTNRLNKGSMLEKVIKKKKYQRDEIAVFGDGLNDVGMLEKFSYSFAPYNADQYAKKAAAYQLHLTNEDGAVKEGIEILEKLNLL